MGVFVVGKKKKKVAEGPQNLFLIYFHLLGCRQG